MKYVVKRMYAINNHIVFPNTQLVHSLNINTLKKPRVFRLTFHSIGRQKEKENSNSSSTTIQVGRVWRHTTVTVALGPTEKNLMVKNQK